MVRTSLFDVGYELVEALDLQSAEPDLGKGHFIESGPSPDPLGALVEGASDLAFWCWVDKEPASDRLWALKNLRVPQAWEFSSNRGAGVMIGQPDTGIASHRELDSEAFNLALAADLINGNEGAEDPLISSAGNPGHGTATSSVVISRTAGRIVGSAPKATLVPIRCIESVTVFDQSRVARAVEHARSVGCHVITMSLGGVPSSALRAAIRRAVNDGVIVLAAAGNCVGLVVYPARYRECICVAANNEQDRPWQGSCRGSSVAVSAPGELVWRALRRMPSDPLDQISGGQGTSFAVALTSGVAALWLSHHGRSKALAEANKRGVTLQDLFRAAVRQTARRPAGWDSANFGAGIVDARALLELKLSSIPLISSESAWPDNDDDDLFDLLAEAAAATGTAGNHIPLPESAGHWPDRGRYSLEIASLVLDRVAVAHVASAEGIEPRPSRHLTELLQANPDPRLRGLQESPLATPTVRRNEKTADLRPTALDYLAILSRNIVGCRMESNEAMTAAEAAERLTPETVRERIRRLEKKFHTSDAGLVPAGSATQALRGQVLADAERALTKLSIDTAAPLDRRDQFALEALIELSGRPSLLVKNDSYDRNDPEVEGWEDALLLAGDRISQTVRSVGRVDLDGQHAGTAFVVGPGLIMTNRHVLEGIADQVGCTWEYRGEVTIDFKQEFGSDERLAFKIKEPIFVGPDPIGQTVSVSKLDLAVLAVEEENSERKPLPRPLPLVENPAASERERQLMVVGYPAKPNRLPRDGNGRIDAEVVAALERIFRFRYGVKRIAPGRLKVRRGQIYGDTVGWALAHDTTTLGGNSGSCVATLDNDCPVLACHMGGQWRKENYAHVLAAVPALRTPAATDRLRDLVWTTA